MTNDELFKDPEKKPLVGQKEAHAKGSRALAPSGARVSGAPLRARTQLAGPTRIELASACADNAPASPDAYDPLGGSGESNPSRWVTANDRATRTSTYELSFRVAVLGTCVYGRHIASARVRARRSPLPELGAR